MKPQMVILALAALLFVAPCLAGASTTVILNSYCSISQLPSGTQVAFHMSNIGNGTAVNVTAVPQLYSVGLSLSPQSAQMGTLQPGANATANFNVSSYTYPGSYVAGFAVQYGQGSSQIATVYPCPIDIGQQEQNYVEITRLNYSKGAIKASFVNLASTPLHASIYVLAPYDVFVSGRVLNETLKPGVQFNRTFNVTLYPPSGVTNATYVVAFATSYIADNISVSGYSTVLVPQRASGGSLFQWFDYLAIAVIVVLVALIILSVAIGRHRRRARAGTRTRQHKS